VCDFRDNWNNTQNAWKILKKNRAHFSQTRGFYTKILILLLCTPGPQRPSQHFSKMICTYQSFYFICWSVFVLFLNYIFVAHIVKNILVKHIKSFFSPTDFFTFPPEIIHISQRIYIWWFIERYYCINIFRNSVQIFWEFHLSHFYSFLIV